MEKQKSKRKQSKPETAERLASGSQSEKISYLIAEIGKLTIALQSIQKEKDNLNQRLIDEEKNNHRFKLDIVKFIMEN